MSSTGRDDIVLARIPGFVTPPDWDGTSLLDERYLDGTTLLLPFSTTDGLVPMPDLLVDPPKGMSFTDFQCVDINRDGYTDLVINTQGAAHRGTLGGPVFYLNDRAGRLVRADAPDLPAMPGTEIGWSATTSAVTDMNGDGVPDLPCFTAYGQRTQLAQPFRPYLRKRLIAGASTSSITSAADRVTGAGISSRRPPSVPSSRRSTSWSGSSMARAAACTVGRRGAISQVRITRSRGAQVSPSASSRPARTAATSAAWSRSL